MPRIELGGVAADPDALAVGESTVPRALASGASTSTTGLLRLSYFTARKTETINNLRLLSGTTAAAATPTLCRAGVYSVAANGDLTLVAAIANDTSLFAATGTAYTRALTTPFAKVAGQRVAVGILVVTAAAAPVLPGCSTTLETAQAPRMAATLLGQTDLPGTIPAASVGSTPTAYYTVLLP